MCILLDSKSSFRPGWNNLRPFPGSLLDFLWSHPDREGRHKDAHTGE